MCIEELVKEMTKIQRDIVNINMRLLEAQTWNQTAGMSKPESRWVKTYADAVAAKDSEMNDPLQTKKLEGRSVPSINILPPEGQDLQLTDKAVRQMLRNAVDRPDIVKYRVKPTGAISIGTQDEQELKKVVDLASDKLQGYKIERPKEPTMRLIIEGVSEHVEEKDVKQMIETQNKEILPSSANWEKLTVVRQMPPHKYSRDIVVDVPESIAPHILAGGVLRIDVERCKVRPYVSLPQCFRCARHGHTTKDCKSEQVRCAKCNGNHTRTECAATEKTVSGPCVFCADKGIVSRADHSSESKNCPVRRNMMELKMAQILGRLKMQPKMGDRGAEVVSRH